MVHYASIVLQAVYRQVGKSFFMTFTRCCLIGLYLYVTRLLTTAPKRSCQQVWGGDLAGGRNLEVSSSIDQDNKLAPRDMLSYDGPSATKASAGTSTTATPIT
jgi:hypothetical protein